MFFTFEASGEVEKFIEQVEREMGITKIQVLARSVELLKIVWENDKRFATVDTEGNIKDIVSVTV